jgi:hypothetical protein
MIMTEFSTLSDIFGRAAWPLIEEINEVVVFDIDANNRSCTIILNGHEYGVKREHNHKWHVVTIGHYWIFGTQWELLAWIGDRL